MRLILIRHADPDEGFQGRCYGSLDVGLSPLGRRQVQELVDALAGVEVSAVLSSPRRRAHETAAAIAARHGLVVEPVSSLRELDFGELEGRRYDEIAQERPELFAQWMEAPTSVTFPGGEGYEDLRARTVAWLERLLATGSDGTVVAVSHGGVIRALVSHILEVPSARIFRIAVATASLTTISWHEGEPVVEELNRSPSGILG